MQGERVTNVTAAVLTLAWMPRGLQGWTRARRRMLAWGGLAEEIWRKEWMPGKLWLASMYPVVHHTRSPLPCTSHRPCEASKVSAC